MLCKLCEPLYWSWPVAELDGDQTLDLYWIDPVEAMDRFVGRPQFKDKIYYQYERQESVQRPSKRAFSRANSGLVFQEAQALDMFSVPMLHLFYSDKSFSGQHGGRYPVSREFWFRISYEGLPFVIQVILLSLLQSALWIFMSLKGESLKTGFPLPGSPFMTRKRARGLPRGMNVMQPGIRDFFMIAGEMSLGNGKKRPDMLAS